MTTITAQTFQLTAPYWKDAITRRTAWSLGAILLASVVLFTALTVELSQV